MIIYMKRQSLGLLNVTENDNNVHLFLDNTLV